MDAVHHSRFPVLLYPDLATKWSIEERPILAAKF